MSQEAMHASAPEQHLCADCTMDKEACPTCYAAWWKRRHPNTIQIPESPAKEQPGEQNAALRALEEEHDGELWNPGVKALHDYPNLQAMLAGSVSGHHTEWPAMRRELRALLAKLGQGWIPVSERFPEENMRVLVRRGEGTELFNPCVARHHYQTGRGSWWEYEPDFVSATQPTHWMPFPPPPPERP